MIKRTLLAATAFAALAVAPALAQKHEDHGHDDMTPARLQSLDDQAKAKGFTVTHTKAIEIAKTKGVVKVHEIDLEDNGAWKVEGQDEHGDHVEVELSARDGSVSKVEHE